MAVERDPRERGARLALPAGGDDQHLARRQFHRGVHVDRRREVLEIAARLGDLDDPIERAPADAELTPGIARDIAERLHPRRVRREGGDEHPAGAGGNRLVEPDANIGFGARRLLVEHIGRVADQSEDTLVTDRGEFGRRRRHTQLRILVDLPVAGVEDIAIWRLDQQRGPLGDRMRERDIGEAERAELEAALILDDVELHLVGNALFLELATDQPRSELGRVHRHAEIGGEIGDRADMILMPVGQHDTEQILDILFDEGQVGQDQLDARIAGIGEGQAEIDHHPFALGAIEIDVHPDLPRATEREEEQFITWFSH